MSYEEKYEDINIIYDNLFDFKNYEIFETKFSSLTRPQQKAFDSKTYEKEKPLLIKNERGQDTEKIILHKNFMRWKYSQEDIDDTTDNIETNDNDPFNLTKLGIKDKINKKIETNSKIIEWSDGSYQLVIGDTYFDILISDAANTNIGLLDIENDIVNVGKSIDKKMILMVSEDFEDRDFLETNKHLERSKVKLANTFFDSTHYVKDENMNKYSKKPSKKEDNESMAGRKRSRP